MNLYTNSMSADELATCLCVKEVSSSCSSPYIGRYVSLLSEPSFSHRARQENPFLTPVQQLAKQIVELRPASASAVASRSSSALSCHPNHSYNKQLMTNTLHTRKDADKLSEPRSLTTTRPSSRTNYNYRTAIRTLRPRPDSHPQDYSTLRIVSRLPSASARPLRPSTTVTAPYLLAPGGQYVSQLIISRSPSQINRKSTSSVSRTTSLHPTSCSMSGSNSTTSCASQASYNPITPLATLENDELDARERELELELQQIQIERQTRAASRITMRSGSAAPTAAKLQKELTDQAIARSDLPIASPLSTRTAKNNAPAQGIVDPRDTHANDPLLTSLTNLSRSSSRNVFLESYVAEETVRRCLQRSNTTDTQPLASYSRDDMSSSQASVLTAVHLGQSNVESQNSPQVAAHALRKLISELLQQSQVASPTVDHSEMSVKQNVESRSESSSPYPNTYSARDYITHEDVLSVFDPDNSLNFGRFKLLAKKFYGRISKGKLWSVAREIDLIDSIDEKIDYLYSFLFNR